MATVGFGSKSSIEQDEAARLEPSMATKMVEKRGFEPPPPLIEGGGRVLEPHPWICLAGVELGIPVPKPT